MGVALAYFTRSYAARQQMSGCCLKSNELLPKNRQYLLFGLSKEKELW